MDRFLLTMYWPESRVLLWAFLIVNPCWTRELRSVTPSSLDANSGTSLAGISSLDLSNLDLTLDAIKNLTETQGRLLEQQREQQRRIQAKNREDEERENARLEALGKEQKLLKEIEGKIGRKIKNLTRAQANHIGNYQDSNSNGNAPKDCADIYLSGDETSGVYWVWPTWEEGRKGFSVYCDMNTDGGGWTVIHRWTRDDIPIDYLNRPWIDYKQGFGDLEGTFWLGNEKIYQLTNQGFYELQFAFLEGNVNTYSRYGTFRIEGEQTSYKLHVGWLNRTGTTDDVFSSHNEAAFSTIETNQEESYRRRPYYSDNSEHLTSCADNNQRGWWFDSICSLHPSLQPGAAEKKLEMKIRPAQFSIKKDEY